MERLPMLMSIGLRQLRIISSNRASLGLVYPQIQNVQSRNAGHSHWANIRHIKGAKDKIKSDVSGQVMSKIRVALREPGGANEKINHKLAKAIEFGERNNVPSKNMKSMIDKILSSKESAVQSFYEARGPNGSFIIFDISTMNVRRTKNELTRHLAKRMGATLMTSGGTSQYFEKKGIIEATPKEGKVISLEQAEDIAISVDAEDVKVGQPCENGATRYEITCDPDSIYPVVKGLLETDFDVLDYSINPVPIGLVDLTESEKTDIVNAIDYFRNLLSDATIDNIYDNINW